jgi:hypothetical protein
MSDRPNALLRLGPIEAPQAPQNVLAPRPTWADAYDANAAWLAQQRAISSQRGLWDDATGRPTTAGVLDAAQQYGNSLLMGTTAPRIETIRLYHGTSPEGLAEIKKTGHIKAPAFFTPDKSAAAEYAYGGPIIEVRVPKSELMVDFDLPGAKLLRLDDANGYSRNKGWTIDDYLNEGHSVGTEGPVSVKDARFHEPD